ncbi:MAG: UDP-N-acetylglucosamine 2-epimerase (non-hydrolyzing) [Bacteroidetes bacterium]|nr:UDP-N-acetylglucosamine 2-epimerase (non-hydrolyzing) [Bacteroidota bacterium]
MIKPIIIDLIAGARPNFMKIAPIIHAISKLKNNKIQFRLIHTGQHYDINMSSVFFKELEIPNPDINLNAGSGSQAEQSAAIMIGYEKVLNVSKPDLCLVVGDVTSTMSCAIVARKMQVPVAHVEGGIRSGDWSMPEEINRIVTDSISNYFFTTTKNACNNLEKTGVNKKSIFFVGNTMIDTLLKNRLKFSKPKIWEKLGLKEKEYIIITLHRPANVDETENFTKIIAEIIANSRELPLIFPVHPRTLKVINISGISHPRLHLIEPLGYLEFNYLVNRSKVVITDSGGITEETTVLGIPCITLRDNTERPETVKIGTNKLIGTNPKAIKPTLDLLFSNKWKKGKIPEKWDGHTSERILNHIINIFQINQL